MKSKITNLEKEKISVLLDEVYDIYGDFYITRNNLRLFIRENSYLLFDNIKKGDKISYNDSSLVVVTGFSDNSDRKYVKILSKDVQETDKLVKELDSLNIDLYAKFKKNNPLVPVLLKNGFVFKAGRGKEILLVKTKKGLDNVR